MNHTKSSNIKDYISPLDTVKRSDDQNLLGNVLSFVDSSHSAVFIFDSENNFQGLISPFKTLYSSNYPYTTKVSSIAFKPPLITENTPIYEAAEYMLGTRIYSLPVFGEDGTLTGVIHGKNILQSIVDDKSMLQLVSKKIQPNTPVTAPLTASVRDVFHTLKEKGVSRMIIIDGEGDLAGIVTRSDLMHSLIKPTAKMRFPKEGSRAGYYSLAGEKKFRKEESIRKYYTVLVDSLPDDTPKEQVIVHLVSSVHNSLVLVNKQNKPTGFLSTRDILQAVAAIRPEDNILIILKKPSESVSDKELEQARKHLELFSKKLQERMEIEKIEVATKGPKNPKGQTKQFNTTVIVTPVAGKAFVALTKQKSYIDGIQAATSLIEKQRRRSGVTKEETKQTFL